MKAVVFHDVGDIRLDEVPDPSLQDPTDAVVRLTASAICGTDLHFVRGTVPGVKPGTILGHEGIGIIEELGPEVRNFSIGDRVVIPSTIACGYCSYCRAGYYAQCDNANPHGRATAFYGGPEPAGSFAGLQAQRARIPMAHVNLVKLPDAIADDEAILLSDIFPTGYFGADLANVEPGKTVAVFGCGPVGQFVIASAKHLGAGRILAIDTIPERLAMARAQGAEVIDYNREDPVETLVRLTGGIGVDRAIDAVGVDANLPIQGPAAEALQPEREQLEEQAKKIVSRTNEVDGSWHPGTGPSIVHQWAVKGLAKAGTLAIIGVYPETDIFFPIGAAINKNLTIRMGNCNHRRYIPVLMDLVLSKVVRPASVLTHYEALGSAIDAYLAFDQRKPGWIKVALAA